MNDIIPEVPDISPQEIEEILQENNERDISEESIKTYRKLAESNRFDPED